MKTAISIPDSLFETAEKLAEHLGLSRSELYQRAVARFIQEHAESNITAALNKVYGEQGEASVLDPVFESMHFASLEDDQGW